MRLDVGMSCAAMAQLGRALVDAAAEARGRDGAAEVVLCGLDNDGPTDATLRFNNEDMERPEVQTGFVVEVDME